MIRLHLKKQICMEGGCMQDSVKVELMEQSLNIGLDLMDYMPELISLVVIVLMFIATIVIGFGKAKRSFERKRGRK